MDISDIDRHLSALDGILVLRPAEGDGTPEIAWNDLFFYYAPDGKVPQTQPFATVVTKNYPGEPEWHTPGSTSFRVNIHVGKPALGELTTGDEQVGAPDTVTAHPAYARMGWICVVDPGENTDRIVLEQLTAAYDRQRQKIDHSPGR